MAAAAARACAIRHLHRQIELNGRDVILDTRRLSEKSIGTLRKILADPKRAAWRDHVLWYDGGP